MKVFLGSLLVAHVVANIIITVDIFHYQYDLNHIGAFSFPPVSTYTSSGIFVTHNWSSSVAVSISAPFSPCFIVLTSNFEFPDDRHHGFCVNSW